MSWTYHGDIISRDDMVSKFRETYIVLQKIGIVFVNEFDRERVLVTPLRDESRWIPSEEFLVEQEFPQVGRMLNYRRKAFRIGRIPQRQWKVGLLRSTLRLTQGEVESSVAALNAELVETLFNPTYSTIHKAISSVIEDANTSFAISPFYWIKFDKESNAPVLMRRDTPVGTIGGDANEDGYNVKMFECSTSLVQEIEDEFKNEKYRIRASL